MTLADLSEITPTPRSFWSDQKNAKNASMSNGQSSTASNDNPQSTNNPRSRSKSRKGSLSSSIASMSMAMTAAVRNNGCRDDRGRRRSNSKGKEDRGRSTSSRRTIDAVLKKCNIQKRTVPAPVEPAKSDMPDPATTDGPACPEPKPCQISPGSPSAETKNITPPNNQIHGSHLSPVTVRLVRKDSQQSNPSKALQLPAKKPTKRSDDTDTTHTTTVCSSSSVGSLSQEYDSRHHISAVSLVSCLSSSNARPPEFKDAHLKTPSTPKMVAFSIDKNESPISTPGDWQSFLEDDDSDDDSFECRSTHSWDIKKSYKEEKNQNLPKVPRLALPPPPPPPPPPPFLKKDASSSRENSVNESRGRSSSRSNGMERKARSLSRDAINQLMEEEEIDPPPPPIQKKDADLSRESSVGDNCGRSSFRSVGNASSRGRSSTRPTHESSTALAIRKARSLSRDGITSMLMDGEEEATEIIATCTHDGPSPRPQSRGRSVGPSEGDRPVNQQIQKRDAGFNRQNSMRENNGRNSFRSTGNVSSRGRSSTRSANESSTALAIRKARSLSRDGITSMLMDEEDDETKLIASSTQNGPRLRSQSRGRSVGPSEEVPSRKQQSQSTALVPCQTSRAPPPPPQRNDLSQLSQLDKRQGKKKIAASSRSVNQLDHSSPITSQSLMDWYTNYEERKNQPLPRRNEFDELPVPPPRQNLRPRPPGREDDIAQPTSSPRPSPPSWHKYKINPPKDKCANNKKQASHQDDRPKSTSIHAEHKKSQPKSSMATSCHNLGVDARMPQLLPATNRKSSAMNRHPPEFDKVHGRCIHHPSQVIAKKKPFAKGWELVRESCPICDKFGVPESTPSSNERDTNGDRGRSSSRSGSNERAASQSIIRNTLDIATRSARSLSRDKRGNQQTNHEIPMKKSQSDEVDELLAIVSDIKARKKEMRRRNASEESNGRGNSNADRQYSRGRSNERHTINLIRKSVDRHVRDKSQDPGSRREKSLPPRPNAPDESLNKSESFLMRKENADRLSDMAEALFGYDSSHHQLFVESNEPSSFQRSQSTDTANNGRSGEGCSSASFRRLHSAPADRSFRQKHGNQLETIDETGPRSKQEASSKCRTRNGKNVPNQAQNSAKMRQHNDNDNDQDLIPHKQSYLKDSLVFKMQYTTPWGKRGLYSGEVNSSGVPHGRGKMCFKDGREHKGQWLNGFSEEFLQDLNKSSNALLDDDPDNPIIGC